MKTGKKNRIMIFGTFDKLHPGHFNLFKQARRLASNPFLIISVARDFNVKKIKNNLPKNSETKRVTQLKNIKYVDKVVLGAKRNYIAHILTHSPNIIALGYDQVAYTANLAKKLAKRGLKPKIYKLRAFKPHVYKSSLL